MTGIAHAWTVVGDRCLIDRDHDTVSLDALEVIYVDKPDDGVAAMVPCQLEVVSLWYRHDPAYGERQKANVCVLSPAGEVLAHFPIVVDLRSAYRYRTRCIIQGLLVERPGTYFVAIDLLAGTPAREVARIPLQVELSS
jgi:hypothetical protein